MNKERRAFHRGMLAALRVIYTTNLPLLYDEIVATADLSELILVATIDGEMEFSGLRAFLDTHSLNKPEERTSLQQKKPGQTKGKEQKVHIRTPIAKYIDDKEALIREIRRTPLHVLQYSIEKDCYADVRPEDARKIRNRWREFVEQNATSFATPHDSWVVFIATTERGTLNLNNPVVSEHERRVRCLQPQQERSS